MAETSEPDALTGHCLCGTVHYRITGRVGPVVYCHCSQCRRASGTAFAANANVRQDDLAFLSGRERVTEFESSPGKFRAFCSRCGSPVYSRSTSDPDHLRIRLGTLDADPGRRSLAHCWVSSKAPSFDITDALPQFPAGPPPRPAGERKA